MATTEERMQILKMIQEGKISAEEGVRLMEALDKGDIRGPRPPAPPSFSGMMAGKPSLLRVRVTDTNTGKVRVNVRLPLSLVKSGIKMGAKFAPEVEGLDMDTLSEFINSGERGQIVDIEDANDGEHIEVFIE